MAKINARNVITEIKHKQTTKDGKKSTLGLLAISFDVLTRLVERLGLYEVDRLVDGGRRRLVRCLRAFDFAGFRSGLDVQVEVQVLDLQIEFPHGGGKLALRGVVGGG